MKKIIVIDDDLDMQRILGDTLKIEMMAHILDPTDETNKTTLNSKPLSPGACMDYYLDLTDTEKLRMSSIEVLFIEVAYEGSLQCFTRDHNTGDYDLGKGKVLTGLELCE